MQIASREQALGLAHATARRLPFLLIALLVAVPTNASEFSARVSRRDVPRLLQATEHVRSLSEEELVALIPLQSGLFFIDCPNCDGGRQESQLVWHPERPDEVECRFCQHRYPSDKYPMDKAVTVRNPRGETVQFPYWENDRGYRHFFQARRDDLVRNYLADQTRLLAQLYVATQDKAHARRAALVIDRFAQVFPGWCYHFDYPFQQKEIYDGDVSPSNFRPGYRTARWTWWAYMDIPTELVEAYDWIRDSGVFEELSREREVDVAERIERDLFRNAAEQVLANRETYGNMSPTAWRALVQTGRILGEPRYVHEVVGRLQHFVDTQFFYDGTWPEGSPDYAAQTIGGLANVINVLSGYSDPPDYVDPVNGRRFENLDLDEVIPMLERAQASLRKMHLPNGRAVPVHDTWSRSRRRGTSVTEPYLLPALGHVCLGGGENENQTQFHLTWSGGYGHSHADHLSLLLFAHERELLSDIGYTHTAYRSWSVTTAAHNTVVIDGQSQLLGGRSQPTDGRLLLCDISDPTIQVVRADGTRGYAGRAKTYERTLVVIDAGNGRRFAVDCFDVEGGQTHDYFLHGDADNPAAVTASLEFTSLESLLPPGFEWTPTRNEGEVGRALAPHYAYGFFRSLRSAPLAAGEVVPVDFLAAEGAGPGVRVKLLPQPDSQLILGENPSIRQAREDDAKLNDFQRPFLLLRRSAANKPSRFVSVIEPYADSPLLESIEPIISEDETVGVRVAANGHMHLVVFGSMAPVTIEAGRVPATFQGQIGVLSLRDDAVTAAFCLGSGGWQRGDFKQTSPGPQGAPLRSVDGKQLIVQYDEQVVPAQGDIVRLVTADGWVYPFTLAGVQQSGEQLHLEVVEGPGLTFDPAAEQLKLTVYPQRQHDGQVRVEWTPATRITIGQ